MRVAGDLRGGERREQFVLRVARHEGSERRSHPERLAIAGGEFAAR
jgi:hypothetical protein